MASKRRRRRLGLERLEDRRTMSGNPLNTIGVASGVVPAPGAVAEVATSIAPSHLTPRRRSTVLGVFVSPSAGSSLKPSIIDAKGPHGRLLPLRHGAPYHPPINGTAVAFVQDNQPGPLTTGITGQQGTTGAFNQVTTLPGDIKGTGSVTLADLRAFSKAFPTTRNDAFYTPAADANQNGIIGQLDARFLERNLTPLTPKNFPLQVQVALAPGEEVRHVTDQNSGGETRLQNVIVEGRTTPGSIVFFDDSFGNYSFSGAAIPTDASGFFSIPVKLTAQLTNIEFLVINPYGQQTIRAFPILYIGPLPLP
jgi:hypothetical protein